MPNDEYKPEDQPLTPDAASSSTQPSIGTSPTVNDSLESQAVSSTKSFDAQENTASQPTLDDLESETTAPMSAVSQPVPVAYDQPQEVVGSPILQPVPIPPASPAPKKSHLKLILLITIPIVLLLGLIGGAVYAYTVYQKPENVVLDAAQKALSASKLRTTTTVTSDFVYEVGSDKVSFEKLTFTTGSERAPRYDANAELVVKYNDKTISLKADALAVSEGAVYFRVSNLKDTLEKTLPSTMKVTTKANEYLAKFDGKWAKYSLDDLKQDNPESEKIARCTLDIYKKYKDDKKSIQEVAALYKANAFLVINGKPTSKDGNLGYEVSVDSAKSKAFAKAVEGTAIAKELKACDKSNDSSVSDTIDSSLDTVDTPVSADAPKTVTTVWISQWGHELRAVDTKTTNISGPNDKKVTVSSHTVIDFTRGATTEVPASTMTFKDWGDAATGVFNELTGNAYANIQSQADQTSARVLATTIQKKAEAYNTLGSTYPSTISDFAKYPESTLSDPTVVLATLPTDSQHVAYKKCTGVDGAQVVYRTSDGTYEVISLGAYSGPTATTALCK